MQKKIETNGYWSVELAEASGMEDHGTWDTGYHVEVSPSEFGGNPEDNMACFEVLAIVKAKEKGLISEGSQKVWLYHYEWREKCPKCGEDLEDGQCDHCYEDDMEIVTDKSMDENGNTVFKLHNGSITIVVKDGSGNLSSTLKEACHWCGSCECFGDCKESQQHADVIDPEANRLHNYAIDGLESFLLACACEGLPVNNVAFQKAIGTAIEAISNNTT